MVKWLALIIGWLSTIVAIGHDIKARKNRPIVLHSFIKRNRTPLVLAVLATAAAVVSAISIVDEDSEARRAMEEANRKDLQVNVLRQKVLEGNSLIAQQRASLDLLQSLALRGGGDIVPICEVAFDVASLDTDADLRQMVEWERSADRMPIAIGFMSKEVREYFFPRFPSSGIWTGRVDIRSRLWHTPILVLSDGRLSSTMQGEQAIVGAEVTPSHTNVGFRFKYRQRYSPLSIWIELNRMAESRGPFMVFSSSSPSKDLDYGGIGSAVVRFYLTDSEEVFAFAPLEPLPVDKDQPALSWRIAKAPELRSWAVPAWAAVRARGDRDPQAPVGILR
jgi:hypothetical protein